MMTKIKKNFAYALKIVLAAIIAIILADTLNLQFSVSAGIVAILSVAFTKRETIQTARNRFIAFVVAIIIAAVCFNAVGYNNYGFFIYLLLFIIICQFMGWNSAMAMDSVLVSHFLVFKDMSFLSLANEVALFFIGVGIGIIANMSLHKNKDYMLQMKRETDELIRQALHRMSIRIMNPDMPGYDGSCFEKLQKSIDEASALAHINYMNQLSREDVEDIEYIAMRKKQTETLYEIYKHLRKIETVPVSAELLSTFFESVSNQYSIDNTAESLLKDFEKLDDKMKEMPLPVQRKEFEDRARLFAIMREMEEFLILKKEYMSRK